MRKLIIHVINAVIIIFLKSKIVPNQKDARIANNNIKDKNKDKKTKIRRL